MMNCDSLFNDSNNTSASKAFLKCFQLGQQLIFRLCLAVHIPMLRYRFLKHFSSFLRDINWKHVYSDRQKVSPEEMLVRAGVPNREIAVSLS